MHTGRRHGRYDWCGCPGVDLNEWYCRKGFDSTRFMNMSMATYYWTGWFLHFQEPHFNIMMPYWYIGAKSFGRDGTRAISTAYSFSFVFHIRGQNISRFCRHLAIGDWILLYPVTNNLCLVYWTVTLTLVLSTNHRFSLAWSPPVTTLRQEGHVEIDLQNAT